MLKVTLFIILCSGNGAQCDRHGIASWISGDMSALRDCETVAASLAYDVQPICRAEFVESRE